MSQSNGKVESASEGATASRADSKVVLKGYDLERYYPITAGPFKSHVGDVKAVDGVDIEIEEGYTQGLVGESGCGKSTLAQMLVGLDDPTGGHIYYDMEASVAEKVDELENTPPEDRTASEQDRLRELRKQHEINTIKGERKDEFRKNTQFVFQNPTSSLNPRKIIRDIIASPLRVHTDLDAHEREERTIELLEEVGLGEDYLYRYPHMLSGGQKQRIAIARAIALNPDIVILDEPTSALDVSVQAQIINLLSDIQDRFDLTYLFISHDLGVVRHVADSISVMYLGNMVESTTASKLFQDSKHPYTEALISSSPATVTDEQVELTGDVPNAEDPPTGCRFHPRCHKAEDFCGWSGRDLVSLISGLSETNKEIEQLDEAITKVDNSGYTAKFTLNETIDIDRAVSLLDGSSEDVVQHRPELFAAIEEVTRDGKKVTIRFQEVDHPSLREDEPNHLVSCYLYD